MNEHSRGAHLKGNTICWCGHEKRLHWWWNEDGDEVICDASNCDCAEYYPQTRVTFAEPATQPTEGA